MDSEGPVCSSCGVPAIAGAKFCRSCGAAIATSKAAAGERTCPQCQRPVSSSAAFCAGCGLDFSGQGPSTAPPSRDVPVRSRPARQWPLIAGVGGGVLVAVVAAVFLLGGGDGDSPAATDVSTGDPGPDSGTAAGDATTVQGESGGGDTPTVEPTASPEPTVAEPPQPYVAGQMASLAEGLEPLQFTIVYEMSGVEVESGTVVDATVTIVSSPPRMALTMDFGAEGLDLAEFDLETDEGTDAVPKIERIVLILDETGASYSCFKLTDPAESSCERFPPAEPDPSAEPLPETVGAAFLEGLKALEEDGLSAIEATPSQLIAGRPARCFVVFRAEDTEDVTSELDGTLCLDGETGIPLLMEGLASGMGALEAGDTSTSQFGEELFLDGTMRATEVLFSAGDEEFVPPYEIVAAE
jgi:Double zinc ribbon